MRHTAELASRCEVFFLRLGCSVEAISTVVNSHDINIPTNARAALHELWAEKEKDTTNDRHPEPFNKLWDKGVDVGR